MTNNHMALLESARKSINSEIDAIAEQVASEAANWSKTSADIVNYQHSGLTASNIAKELGFKNLDSILAMLGDTPKSKSTLINWNRGNPDLFKLLMLGAVAERIGSAGQ